MRYIKLVGVCLVVTLGVCVVVASASAAEDIYKIEGSKLEAGETVGITASAKTEFTLQAKGALEIEAVIKCKGLKLDEGQFPEVIGGTPGTSAKEVIDFEECSATVGGSKCSSAEIENAEMNNELVTIRAPSGLSGKLATVFIPASGTTLMRLKLNKCGIFGSESATVEGTTAAATSPEGVFEPEGEWAWNEKEQITEIEKHNGTKEKVGLTSDKKQAVIQGAARVALPPAEYKLTSSPTEGVVLNKGEEVTVKIENISGKKRAPLAIVTKEVPGGEFKVEPAEVNACSRMVYEPIEPGKKCEIKVKYIGNNAAEWLIKVFGANGRFIPFNVSGV
jgi:hypothetical protein